MAKQRYVLLENHHSLISCKALKEAKFARVTSQNPCAESEWECGNDNCPVTVVTIQIMVDNVVELHCPGCGVKLDFQRWFDWEMLIPFEESGG